MNTKQMFFGIVETESGMIVGPIAIRLESPAEFTALQEAIADTVSLGEHCRFRSWNTRDVR